MKCPVCGSASVRRYFALANSPHLQNVLYDTLAAAQAAVAIDAEFWACEACLFLFNPAFEDKPYSTAYNNDQSFSPAYRAHLQSVTELIMAQVPASARIVEIGCGNGLVLSMLHDAGYRNVEGYDPAHAGGLPFVRTEYWRPGGAKSDVLIMRHALESMPDFRGLLGAASSEIDTAGMLYLELTNARFILETASTITLYHEYPQYFSEASIGLVLKDIGFYVHALRHFSGGEILGVVARRMRLRTPLRVDLGPLRAFTNACIWGISGRSIHFLTQNRVDTQAIRFAVDIDPRKQGRFIPRTGQRVLSPEEAIACRPDAAVVLNERYVDEVAGRFPYPVAILTNRDFYNE